MRFTVSKSALSKALTIVSKGMASSSNQPILSGVYLLAEEGTLEFQTTDGTISIRHRCQANIEEPGECVISGKLLQNIVKNFPDAPVTFEAEGNGCYITCEASRFLLNTLEPELFPGFPEFQVKKSLSLPREVLSAMVDKVYRVTSKDTSRPILSGILLTAEDNVLRLVATDSYRLAVCDTNTETSDLEGSFEIIVNGNVLHDVLSLPNDTDSILINTTDSQVIFTFGNTCYVSRKIEGRYPDYKKLLPKDCSCSVKVSLPELEGALRRVSAITQQNPAVKFSIDVDGQVMKLSATSGDLGTASETLDVEAEGESVDVALNYRYVNDCIAAESGEKDINFELQGPMKPTVFKAYSTINYLYMLMPVRM